MTKTLLIGIAALLLQSTANAKPLTPKQVQDYKALRSIGITKRDARRVVRDPGVKKGEWGWVCEVDPAIRVYKVPGEGSKYKRNAVCE